MITYQSSKIWQRPWFIAVVGCVAVGAGAWAWLGRSGSSESVATTASAASSASQAPGDTAGTAMPMSPVAPAMSASLPAVLADGRPSDVSPEDWTAINKALGKQGKPKSEAERVVGYLRFQRTFEYWQAMENSRDVQQRHQLAESLLEQLPAHMAKGGFSLREALMLNAVLIADLEPDETKRLPRLEAANARLTAITPMTEDEKIILDSQIATEAKRREAVAIAEWLAKPPSGRDEGQLDQALEAAKRAPPP